MRMEGSFQPGPLEGLHRIGDGLMGGVRVIQFSPGKVPPHRVTCPGRMVLQVKAGKAV